MEKLTILGLLKDYQGWIDKDEVQFLKKNSDEKENISNLVKNLIQDFEIASEKGDLSDNLDWYETHKKGCELWHGLASLALKNIENGSKGNSELFKFLEAATAFEDILYGLEPYYRDHTLHSLWVYLIGEHLLRGQLSDIYHNLNWYLYNDIEKEKQDYNDKLYKESVKKEKEIYSKVNEYKDAIWCIVALCHDLGYSLSKLDKLNEKAMAVLKFFDLSDFRHIGYSLEIEKQFLVSQFLELMAMDVRIVPATDLKEVLFKCYRDDSTYWRLCKALEKKQHGILSAYLIYKTLGIFADSWVRGPSEDWGLDDREVIQNITRGVILFAIAQHQFDFAFIYQLGGLGEVLILADELEEFSRYGRETLSRKYYDTVAYSSVQFIPNKPKQGKDLEIIVTYDVAEQLKIEKKNLYDFYKRKAEQLCKFYSLDQYEGTDKYSAIKSVKIVVKSENETLYFHLFRDEEKNKGKLPATTINGVTYPAKEYKLICIDDEIYHIPQNAIKISLKEWFDNIK